MIALSIKKNFKVQPLSQYGWEKSFSFVQTCMRNEVEQILKRYRFDWHFNDLFLRAPWSWPHCTQSFMMRRSGKRHTPSTRNTFWTRMVTLGRERPSFPFPQVSPLLQPSWTRLYIFLSKSFIGNSMRVCRGLVSLSLLNSLWSKWITLDSVCSQVSVCVLGNSWPGWSYFSSLPPSCRGFPSRQLLGSRPVWSSSWEPSAVPNLTVSVPYHDKVSGWLLLSFHPHRKCTAEQNVISQVQKYLQHINETYDIKTEAVCTPIYKSSKN